jgi:predicted RNA binding protein YcfA (HicA-like mRNA interferase family)
MKSVSGKKLCKIVEQKGWVLKKITGSHDIYEKSNEAMILSVPVHRNQDLAAKTDHNYCSISYWKWVIANLQLSHRT